ncbi:MAG: hypothetical protein ACTSPS_10305, partial [Promethearchaeota archaeon]
MNKKYIISYSLILITILGSLSILNSKIYDGFRNIDEDHEFIVNDINEPDESGVISRYYQSLDLDKAYVYNVTYWEPGEIISYWDYNFADQGDINASTGGQVHVNFTGFYDKHPTDDNVFANPVPYVNMTMYQNQSNSLTWNATFYEVSSSEVGYVLGLSYNMFRAGFLIPINDLDWIIEQAEAQDTPDWAACTVNIVEYYDEIKIEFLQDSTYQNTSLIYNKNTGLLVWAKVETISFFGSADFIVQLNGYELELRPFNNDYSREFDIDKTYVYNVTYWEPGEIISYWDYNWGDIGDANASTGGQIHVEFTGFYDKHPTDDNVFANPVPYINMTVYQNQSNSLTWNATFDKVSSSEAGYVLGLSYNTFRAGFLIPTNILNEIPQMVYMQDTPDWAACTVNVEEYYDVIKIEFLQDSTWQNTSLIYDKTTGLLVWAKVETVSFFGSADFEIQLDGYNLFFRDTNPLYSQDLDLDKAYVYNVTYWEPGEIISYWDYNWGDRGDINASTGGQIHVDFTGFYDKHPTDDNIFANPVPYINMTIFQNQSKSLAFNSTFSNVSCSEAGYVLGICYNQFRAGFLVPTTFLNLIKLYAQEQNTLDWAACTVNVEEYDFIIKIEFSQDSTWQNTSLIYDKKTGLLVWAKVETVSFFGSADFEIILNGYDLNFQKTQNYDQSGTTGFEKIEIFVGNLAQGSSVYVGEYQ